VRRRRQLIVVILHRVSARRVFIVAAAVVAAVWLALLMVAALRTIPTDCDNVAGTCLRQRQQLAIGLLAGLYAIAATACVWIASRAARGNATRAIHKAGLSASIALVAAAALIDPAGHLDNRYHGWLT
jgi:hypothetical protein